MASDSLFAPAKLNVFLAITGKREDGFHDLVSVVVPLVFGDQLTLTITPEAKTSGRTFTLTCTDPAVPLDETNLVLRAAAAFVAETGWAGAGQFHLEKCIPMGAGLGGGSSNGATALKLLNRAAGGILDAASMARLAASLGSDCPLFLHDAPVVMRGRGERVEPLATGPAARLRGRRVLVFKPAFGIPTAWAYRQLAADAAAGNAAYLPLADAEARLSAWIAASDAPAEQLLFNNLERPAFSKHMALPTLLDQLGRDFGLRPMMTGSGSACFAFLPEDAPRPDICAAIRASWGESVFVMETALA